MRFGPNPLPSIPEPNPDDMAIMRSLLLPIAAFGMKSFAKCSYDVIFRMCVSAPACWCGVARQLRTLLACARTHTQTHAMHARNELHSRTPFESVRASVCVCVCVCACVLPKKESLLKRTSVSGVDAHLRMAVPSSRRRCAALCRLRSAGPRRV